MAHGDYQSLAGSELEVTLGQHTDTPDPTSPTKPDNLVYKLYKRRFIGLAQLVLLNIIVSWDWLTFSAISDTSAIYFHVSQSAINWLSTGFFFAFVLASPVTMRTLNRGGPKAAILCASGLILVGNWMRYLGAYSATHSRFPLVVIGQVIIGFAQPFVLVAPTRYSQQWFSDSGRVSATAIASLANPLGGALGQLIGPLLATSPAKIPTLVLYTALISSLACIPCLFLPSAPPIPSSSTSSTTSTNLVQSLTHLRHNTPFLQIALPFSIYVGAFNASSSLLNQIFSPYGFSETSSGIAGALMISIGLLTSALISPLVDRTKAYSTTIKILVPVIATAYTVLMFVPPTKSVAAAWIVCAVIGAASFSLLPTALEYLVLITHPASPEVASTVCWAGGQLLGAVFLIIMDALRGSMDSRMSSPPGSMKNALIFQAVVCWLVVPFPLLLGVRLWSRP